MGRLCIGVFGEWCGSDGGTVREIEDRTSVRYRDEKFRGNTQSFEKEKEKVRKRNKTWVCRDCEEDKGEIRNATWYERRVREVTFLERLFESLLKRVLGSDFHLVYADVLISFPGAADQQWHVDGPHRAGAQEHYPPDILNVFVALDDIDVSMGPTEIRPRHTHKLTRNIKKQVLGAILTKKLRPKVCSGCKCGDALVFDYRTLHRGVANLSSRPRPVLGLVFGRKEYEADKLNFPSRSVFDLCDNEDDDLDDTITKSKVLSAASAQRISLDPQSVAYVLEPQSFKKHIEHRDGWRCGMMSKFKNCVEKVLLLS